MIIGITGGIGSGKSAVAVFLSEAYGFVHISSDEVAKDLMASDQEMIAELKNAFGSDIYRENGELNRQKYAEAIYKSEEKRRLSDRIVHPRVWEHIKSIASSKDTCYVVETALPGDSFREFCDEIWFVFVDKETRIRRLAEGRGYERAYAESVIRSQQPDEYFRSFSDAEIDNSGSFEKTEEIIRKMIKERF